MSSNYDLDALFHPNVNIEADKGSKSSGEYSPSADKGQNGVYKSIIRFVTWWPDPNNSIFDKWVCWLVDPVTSRGRSIDCPSSVGQPSPLQDMYWKFKNSESVQDQKKAEIFSRRHQYAAIIQVIKDDQNKEAEGKLLVWKFGKKIQEKIEAEKKPVLGDPHEPFDLLDGKAFALIINKVAGYNNYDQSRFLDKKIPLLIPRKEDGQPIPINNNTPREEVFNFLKENSPDLSQYAFKEWDQETHDYVNAVILGVSGVVPSTGFANVRDNVNKPSSPSQSSSNITSQDLSLDDLNLDVGMGGLSDLNLPDIGSPENITGLSINLDDELLNL
jgi:hypothetical protein